MATFSTTLLLLLVLCAACCLGGALGTRELAASCSWPGHCAGAPCSTYNDCSDDLVCISRKCAKDGTTPAPTPASKPTPVPTKAPTKAPTAAPTSGSVLYSGTASGTYYFDVHGNYCPQDSNGYAENNGYPSCTSRTPGPNQKTLSQLNSNNIIAIDDNLLSSNRAKYCGKKVIVTYQGKQVAAPDGGDFYVWDGCAACVGGNRIDFSVSAIQRINANACTVGVVPGVSFQVVDQVVKNFVA